MALVSELDGQLGSENPKAEPSLGDRAGASPVFRNGFKHQLRLWLDKLYEKFGRAEREALARKAEAKGLQVAVKYKKADGTWAVSGAENPHLLMLYELET